MNIFGIDNDDDSTIDNNMWNSPSRSSTKQKHRVTNNNRGRGDTTTQRTHRRNESLDKLRLLSASHQQTTKKDNKVAMPSSTVVDSSSKVNHVQRDKKNNVSITIDKRTQQYSETKQQPSLIAAAAIKQLQEASLQNKIQQTSSFNELEHPKHSSYSKLELVADSDDGISAESEEGYITKSKRSTLRNVIRSVSPLSRNNIRSVSPAPPKRGSSLTRKKGRQSRNVIKRQGSRGRSSSVDTEGQRHRASSLKATSRYSSTTPLQRHQRHSSLSLNHDEKNEKKQYKQSTSQEVEKRVTFQVDHKEQENQGRGRSSRPTSPTSFFPLRSRQRSASPSMFGRRISDLSRSLSPTRILPTVGGGCAAMNLGGNSDSSPTQSISNYASSLVPSSVSNLLLFQCGGGGLGNAALGNGSKEDADDKDLGDDNDLLEETLSKETNENKKTTINGGDSIKVPIVRVDSLVLKSNTEDRQKEQEVCCTTIERSYSTPIPSILDGVEDGEGESEVHHRGHRRTMSGSINKMVKGKGNKASNRSLEALNLMKGRVKKSRMAVQPPKMKTKPSSTLSSSSVPPLANKSHRRSTSWGRSATSPMKRFSHRRSLSTGGGNVFPSSSSLAAQSSPLTRSASFSSGLPKSSAAAAAVVVDDDSPALPQATTPSDRGIADNTSEESPTGVDDDLNLLTHETKFLAEITKTATPTPPLCDSRDVQQPNFLRDYHLKRGQRIHMTSDKLSLSTSPPGESSPVRPLNLDEILKSSTTKEQEVSTRKKKKSVATLMSTNSSIVELALIEKGDTDVSEKRPPVSNSRNSLLDKDIDAAAKSVPTEALPSKEDDDISSIVVPTTSSSLASTKNVAVETCKTKETDTPQQEYDDAILMLKSRAKQRQEDTPTACQTRPPPARWPPKEEDQITLKYSITRESNEKGEDDSFLSSSSAPSELDSLPAVYMNDEHDMRSTSTNTSSKFHRDIGQFSTVVSVNSMSAIYSQDEDKMVEREASTKDITKRDINTLNDFDSIAAESELTEDTVFDTRLDVLPTVDETKSIASAQQLGPTNDKKFDSSRHGTTTQDCNYNTTLDTAYEEFGVERQLAIIDENGRKARQGMKLRLIKPRNFGLPWKPNKPVDVDETSFATSLADNSVKSTYSNNSGDDEEVGQLDWLCGDMCGNEDDIVNDEYTTAGFTIATQGRSIMTTSSKPKPKPKDNKFDKIMDVMEYVLTGYKACETEFDCQTEYDGKTVDTGLGLDDETNVHSQKSRNENINGVVNIDAIRMQGMIFESPTDDKSKANVDLFEC